MANTEGRFVDPMFYIPEDMIGFARDEDAQYVESQATEDELDDVDLELLESDLELVDEMDVPDGYDTLDTPDILGIISQTVRVLPDGSSAVDIILDVEDIAGTSKYEFRVTKI